MPSSHDKLDRLRRALDESLLVRIDRSLPFSDREYGYLVAIGAKWALLAKVSDGGYFDGYLALRLSDVKRVARDKSFAVRAWALLNADAPTAPAREIDLDTTRGLLESAGADETVLGIEKQSQRRAMWIGVVDEVRQGTLWLRELDTKARWSKRPLGYKLAKITSVSWGDRYMNALAACASETPAKAPRLTPSEEPA